MSITRESLTDEIVENARRDRKRLELVADGLVIGFNRVSGQGEKKEEENLDSEVAAAYAEEVAAISDSLSRITHEMVELVKLERKGEKQLDPSKLAPDEVERAFDEIQPEELQ